MDDFFGDVSIEDHAPVTPSALVGVSDNDNSGLYHEPFLFVGVIKTILPPSDPFNKSKNQYEYLVTAPGKINSYTILHCIISDTFGGQNDYEHFTLKVGYKVLVECVMGRTDSGVIVGGVRNNNTPIKVSLGHHWIKRFNNITTSITKDSEYYVKHDDGNEIKISKDKIEIKDNASNFITLDKAAKKITISDGSGETIVIDKGSGKITITAKDMSIDLKGKADIKVAKDAKIEVKGKTDIKSQKDLTVNSTAKVIIKGANKVDIKGGEINLNGALGNVVTTLTHPVDYLTGIPIQGSPTVKAG